MTPSEIQQCFDRANAVLNGFKKPSERNARDVVALLRHYSVAQKVDRKPESAEMPDFLKSLFGGFNK